MARGRRFRLMRCGIALTKLQPQRAAKKKEQENVENEDKMDVAARTTRTAAPILWSRNYCCAGAMRAVGGLSTKCGGRVSLQTPTRGNLPGTFGTPRR